MHKKAFLEHMDDNDCSTNYMFRDDIGIREPRPQVFKVAHTIHYIFQQNFLSGGVHQKKEH